MCVCVCVCVVCQYECDFIKLIAFLLVTTMAFGKLLCIGVHSLIHACACTPVHSDGDLVHSYIHTAFSQQLATTQSQCGL